MASYWTLDLSVSKANMLQSPYILSPAPVFAAVLAMHALDRELGKPDGEAYGLGIEGVGIVHHDAKPWIDALENTKGFLENMIVQRRGACLFGDDATGKSKKPQQNALQPMALCDLRWTLVLAGRREADARRIEKQMSALRLAGGTFRSVRVSEWETLDDALHSLRTGFWVRDISDQIAGKGNPMEALLHRSKEGPWRIPANLGYALLESPAEGRQGAREGCPHAFAEHLIGLLEFVPMVRLRGQLTQADLWRFGWDDDQFLVTNRPISLSPMCGNSGSR